MSRPAPLLAAAALLLTASCGEPPEAEPPKIEYRGGSTRPQGGGGGLVATGGGDPRQAPALESRYRAAQELVRRKDYDRAQAELKEVAIQASGTPLGQRAAAELKTVEARIWALPSTTVDEALRGLPSQLDRRVLIRGLYAPGGQVGVNAQYFWVRQDEQRMQCRYHKMTQADKRYILQTQEGAPVAVRGVLRPAWSGNQDPYLEATLFRNE